MSSINYQRNQDKKKTKIFKQIYIRNCNHFDKINLFKNKIMQNIELLNGKNVKNKRLNLILIDLCDGWDRQICRKETNYVLKNLK